MKKKCVISWCIFAVCLVATFVSRFFVDAQKVEYEEVEVKVLSAKTERGYDMQTHSSYEDHEVKVEYEGEIYELGNVFDTYTFHEGSKTTAYLFNGKLYANVEGVTSSTTVSTVYFAFLIGSFVMFFVAIMCSAAVLQQKLASGK